MRSDFRRSQKIALTPSRFKPHEIHLETRPSPQIPVGPLASLGVIKKVTPGDTTLSTERISHIPSPGEFHKAIHTPHATTTL